MTEWIRNWKLNGFGKVKNRDLFQRLQKLVEERQFPVYWVGAGLFILRREIDFIF